MTVSGSAIVAEVEKFTGASYVYGAAGPKTFDCSGLVQYVLTTLGIKNVPRTSEEQYAWSQHVTRAQLQPGDLVFAEFPGDNASPGHVGVYLGNGKVLSAEDPAQGVGVDTLTDWGSAIVGYGRVPGAAAGGDSGSSSSSSSGSLGALDQYLGDIWSVIAALFSPSTYVRAAAGIVGVVLLGSGLFFLIRAAT